MTEQDAKNILKIKLDQLSKGEISYDYFVGYLMALNWVGLIYIDDVCKYLGEGYDINEQI